ncbi:hypothetical protein [Nitrospira sp. Nam74]
MMKVAYEGILSITAVPGERGQSKLFTLAQCINVHILDAPPFDGVASDATAIIGDFQS